MSLEAVKRNGHKLDLGIFEQAGEYGIPILRPVSLNEKFYWMRFNHSLKETDRENVGVHFFIDDYLFERAWNDPPRYADFLLEFRAVMTPDFSMFADWPKAVNVYNHWRKHLLGAFWQRKGLTVIPSVSWIDKESFTWCFDGEPQGGTVAVSSVGTQKKKETRQRFIDGYREMISRLQPDRIIFFGDVPDECQGNIEHHAPYYETFDNELDFRQNKR